MVFGAKTPCFWGEVSRFMEKTGIFVVNHKVTVCGESQVLEIPCAARDLVKALSLWFGYFLGLYAKKLSKSGFSRK